jgi:hypothetical protein
MIEMYENVPDSKLIKTKIFIITDERCGATNLCNIFKTLGFKVIGDPQTYNINVSYRNDRSINNKTYVINNLGYFYDQYDIVKVSVISFTFEEYTKIINEAKKIGCKFIFLVRKNLLKRAISKAIAQKFDVWNYSDKINFGFWKWRHGSFRDELYSNIFKNIFFRIMNVTMYYLPFFLDEKFIETELIRNQNSLIKIREHLSSSNIDFYKITYENLYDENRAAEERFSEIVKILKWLYYDKNISNFQYAEILGWLGVKRKINKNVYSRIINYKKIVDKFGDSTLPGFD